MLTLRIAASLLLHAGRDDSRPAWINSSSTRLNALILGGTYALLGIGLTLIFGIMRVVNFTHGELYTFGAYMMYHVGDGAGRELLSRAGARGAAGRRARARPSSSCCCAGCAAPTSTPPCW